MSRFETAEFDESRRSALRAAARWVILAGAGYFVGKMVARRNEKCEADFICGRCRLASTCVLPQAVSYRLEKEDPHAG